MNDLARRLAALLLATATGSLSAIAGPGPPAAEKAERPARPPSIRCFSPQGETIPAQKVLKDLADGKDVDLQGRIIEGSLDADAVWPSSGDDRRVSLRVVRGRLRCNSCRINGRISFPHCALLQGVDLTCSEVLGEVDFSDSDIRGGILAERARLGELRLVRTSVDGDVQLKSATIEDRLDVSGSRLGLLSMTDSDVRRDVDLARTVAMVVNLTGSRVAGSMRLEDCVVFRGLTASSATFGRGFTIESVRVYGPMDLSGAAGAGSITDAGDAGSAGSNGAGGTDPAPPAGVAGVFTLSDLVVEGQLLLPLAFDSSLALNNVSVQQGLVLLDGSFGEVSMNGVRVKGESTFDGARFNAKVVFTDSDFGKAFSASEAVFLGDVEFRQDRFAGNDPMEGALFARAPTLTDTVLPKPPRVMSDTGESGPDEDDDQEPPDEEP